MNDVLKKRYAASLMNTFGPPKLALVRGDGPVVWDVDGNRYLDFLGGIAVNALGHGHPALVSAVTQQLSTLGHVSNFFTTEPQVTLAERLLDLLSAEGKVFFANSGTEANEAALKLTRRTGRTRVVAMEGGFHGRTMGAPALTSKAAYREPFEPLPGGVQFVPYGDVDALKAAVTDETAAVVVEPMQGEAGVVEPPAGYLEAVRRVTSEHGALMWVDEVQTGVGRTGRFLAQEHEGVRADITTLGKGLGAGLPVSAVLANERAACFELGDNGSTHGGNPLMAHVALAVCRVISEPAFLTTVRERGVELADTLAGLAAQWGGARTRGAGLLAAMVFEDPIADRFVELSREEGLLCNAARPKIMRFMPQLRVTTAEIGDMAARLGRAHARLATASPTPPAARRDEPPR